MNSLIRNILNRLCVLLVAGLSPLAASPATGDDPVLMRVGGRDVLLSEFEYACHRLFPASADDGQSLKDLVRSYADFQLKVQAARRAGLDTLSDFRHGLDVYRARLFRAYWADSSALDRALRRRYDRLAARGPRVQVMQIFRRLPQNVTSTALRAAVVQMDSIYAALQQAGPDAFAGFVARFSDDPRTRWVARLEETAEFEDTVCSLSVGNWSRPFFTPRGLHIVRVLQRSEVPSFEAVRDSLLRACPSCVEEAVREYATRLSGRKRLTDTQLRSVLADGFQQLEQQDLSFRLAVQAYADSLLAQAVTRRELATQADSATLQHYFGRHHTRYRWDTPRYRGIVLLCSSRRVAKRARKMLKHLPQEDWLDAIRLLLNNDGVQVQARQGTFAPGQDAWVDEHIFKQGEAPARPGYEYVVLLGRKLKGPEDYREVAAAVTADWQASCEARWLDALRDAAKVEINQEVLKTVNYQRNKR